MKCLILGGGGFLGSHLCDALLAEGHAIRVFDRPNLKRYRTFSADEDVEWLEGDFSNSQDLARVVPGCDIVYHLVSTTLPKSSNDNPVYDIETNLVSTLNLLEVSRMANVARVIFISSGGTVYGVPTKIPITEEHPTDPICSYGISKLAIEKYLQLYYRLHGLDYCILRLANPFGGRQRVTGGQGAVAVFLDKALRNEPVEIWGDGSVVRDYIHVSDVVTALVKSMALQGDIRILNVGSGEGKSLNELVAVINKLTDGRITPIYKPARSLDVPVSVLDIGRAKSVLSWVPTVSFNEGVKATLDWMREHSPERYDVMPK